MQTPSTTWNFKTNVAKDWFKGHTRFQRNNSWIKWSTINHQPCKHQTRRLTELVGEYVRILHKIQVSLFWSFCNLRTQFWDPQTTGICGYFKAWMPLTPRKEWACRDTHLQGNWTLTQFQWATRLSQITGATMTHIYKGQPGSLTIGRHMWCIGRGNHKITLTGATWQGQ